MNNDMWGHLKYRIPEFVDEVKSSIVEREKFIMKKEALQKRLRSAQEFFRTAQDPGTISRGIGQLREVMDEIGRLEEDITTLDMKVISILEARLTKISFKFRMPPGINEVGEDVAEKEVCVVPWHTVENENVIEITPEDVWIFRIARKVFEFSTKSIEFLDSDRIEEIFSND